MLIIREMQIKTTMRYHFTLVGISSVQLLSRVQLFATPWTGTYQAPLFMGFSGQEYWSGVPLPSLMTSLDSILKSRDITLLTKVCIVKPVVFPAVMYGCESWSVKKAEHPRIDVFELWCWKRLLRVPWTARRANQPLNIHSKD